MNQKTQFAWPHGKSAALSFSFDDGIPSQVDRGLPILDAHNVKATFYVSVPGINQRPEGWKLALRNGHEIGNHTLHHPCSGNFPFARGCALEDYTIDDITEDIAQADGAIKDLLDVQPTTFAYPCGQKFVGRGVALQSYIPIVAQHFLAGRGFRDEAPNAPEYCDLAQLTGVEADNTSLDELMSWIELAIETNGWIIFVAHHIGGEGRYTISEEVLDAVCRHAAHEHHNLWIDTVANIASHIQKHQSAA